MAPKLTGFVGNSRVRRVLAAAALAGVELDYDKSFSMKSDYKTKEFLAKNPAGYLPFLEDGDFSLAESAAIAQYVTELGPNQTILPSDLKERAKVYQWMAFADQEIFLRHSLAYQLFSNQIPYTKPAYTTAVDRVMARLDVLEKVLLNQTFIVGERITLADVFIVSALANAFSGHIHAELRKKVPNTVRYFETVINHPKLAPIFDNGKPELAAAAPQYQAPQKDQKPKEAAKEKPAQPKAEKKPKAKEVDEEEEEPLVPAEPKVKNPLDDLPKSAFNLEEWKRQYSNLDTPDALKWFYEKFDSEGFSIWRIDFKYNEELTQVFMSSNQIGGFFNRLEASRKYLFGSVGVLGKANDSIITGALITRGQEIEPTVSVAPDWESYAFKRLDLSNEEDKAFFEGAMSWELTVDGKQWADGKNYK